MCSCRIPSACILECSMPCLSFHGVYGVSDEVSIKIKSWKGDMWRDGEFMTTCRYMLYKSCEGLNTRLTSPSTRRSTPSGPGFNPIRTWREIRLFQPLQCNFPFKLYISVCSKKPRPPFFIIVWYILGLVSLERPWTLCFRRCNCTSYTYSSYRFPFSFFSPSLLCASIILSQWQYPRIERVVWFWKGREYLFIGKIMRVQVMKLQDT